MSIASISQQYYIIIFDAMLVHGWHRKSQYYRIAERDKRERERERDQVSERYEEGRDNGEVSVYWVAGRELLRLMKEEETGRSLSPVCCCPTYWRERERGRGRDWR